jgi:uncharacterized protein with HEPN domain
MYPRGWQGRVQDILEAIENVRTFTEGMTFEEFVSDMKTVKAVAFEVSLIGEAASHIPDEVRTRYPQVPWQKMVGMRNVIVHEYFRVDAAILWHTVVDNLPPLVPMLRKALENDA